MRIILATGISNTSYIFLRRAQISGSFVVFFPKRVVNVFTSAFCGSLWKQKGYFPEWVTFFIASLAVSKSYTTSYLEESD